MDRCISSSSSSGALSVVIACCRLPVCSFFASDVMGQYVAKFSKALNDLDTLQLRMVILGLDGAGKTTIFYRLLMNTTIIPVPTTGFNVEDLRAKGVKFNVWDLGGHERVRKIWHHYLPNTDALVYVVDSCDRERLTTSGDLLYQVMKNEAMYGVPILVLANRIDHPDAMSIGQVVDGLRLRKLRGSKRIVQGVASGDNNEALIEGLERLAQFLRQKRELRATW